MKTVILDVASNYTYREQKYLKGKEYIVSNDIADHLLGQTTEKGVPYFVEGQTPPKVERTDKTPDKNDSGKGNEDTIEGDADDESGSQDEGGDEAGGDNKDDTSGDTKQEPPKSDDKGSAKPATTSKTTGTSKTSGKQAAKTAGKTVKV